MSSNRPVTGLSTVPVDQIQTDRVYTRPSLPSYNNNAPSPITEPTPAPPDPTMTANPVDISAINVEIPANTSQINNRPTTAPSTPTVQTMTATSSKKILYIGIGVIALVVLYFILKKYKKI